MIEKTIYKTTTKTGKNLTIRYLSHDDTKILLDFINKISKEKTFITFQGEQLTFEEEDKYVKSRIEEIKEKKSVHLLAFINNDLAGSSDINPSIKIKPHRGVFGIVLAKKYRSEGIGTILMENVIREALKNIKNLKIITLEVFGDNFIAQKLYRKMGFIEWGLLPKGIKHKNKYVDQILMYKKIR